MIIAITGTPGTGKTTLAERLSKKLGYALIGVNDLARKNGLVIGHDKKRDADIIDVDSLRKVRLDDKTIIEGHLSHHVTSDIIIVLRCAPEDLYKRLTKRVYKRDKIKENLEAECLGLITAESLSKNTNVYEIDTTGRSISDTLDDALEIVGGKRNKYKPKVDYLEKITELDDIMK